MKDAQRLSPRNLGQNYHAGKNKKDNSNNSRSSEYIHDEYEIGDDGDENEQITPVNVPKNNSNKIVRTDHGWDS